MGTHPLKFIDLINFICKVSVKRKKNHIFTPPYI